MIDFIEGLGKVKISVRWPSSSFAVRSSMSSTNSASSESMLQWVENVVLFTMAHYVAG